MAKTQKSYRLGARGQRSATKLNTFSSGMYLTNQIIPEGYAKTLVNYDIDDTGSHIRPRQGRVNFQTFEFNTPTIGAVTLTDYLYTYNDTRDTVVDLKDTVLSFGTGLKLKDIVSEETELTYTRPIYLANMLKTTDTNIYDEHGDIEVPGEIINSAVHDCWSLYWNKNNENFDKAVTYSDTSTNNIGYTTARAIEGAYAFDKPLVNTLYRPVGAVLNNELVNYTAPVFSYEEHPNQHEKDIITDLETPKLGKVFMYDNPEGPRFGRQPVTLYEPTPSTATTTGFNLLLENPYSFKNVEGGTLASIGTLVFDVDDVEARNPIFNQRIGKNYNLYIYYQFPSNVSTLKYRIQQLDLNSSSATLVTLHDFNEGSPITVGEESYIIFPYTQTLAAASLYITLRPGTASTADQDTFSTRPMLTTNTQLDNFPAVTFDLSTCTGMFTWNNCAGIYGVEGAKDIVFLSDVENPGYFPYPYNIMQFDNEVLAVHNYLEYLIVVTVDSIWLVSGSPTQQTQKCILKNINIPEIDAYNLIVLKDQIFFKTDTQFYVLKPNQYTSDATDLKNYTNSTAISNFTTNFTVETVNMLNSVYKTVWQDATRRLRTQVRFVDFDVLDIRSVLRNEDVHYIYRIKPKLAKASGEQLETNNVLDLHLVYNTLARTWRIHFENAGKLDITTNGENAPQHEYNPISYKNKQSGEYYEFIGYNGNYTDLSDADAISAIVINKRTTDLVTDNIIYSNEHCSATDFLDPLYDNWQYIDTGNIAIDDIATKRFREVQFNIVNKEEVPSSGPDTRVNTKLSFSTDFKLDSIEQVSATDYEVQTISDPLDPDYGKIYVQPTEILNLDVPGNTILGDDNFDFNFWTLDFSKFPELNLATVRFELRGRGRHASLQLLCTGLKRFELSDINWVYRAMSAR